MLIFLGRKAAVSVRIQCGPLHTQQPGQGGHTSLGIQRRRKSHGPALSGKLAYRRSKLPPRHEGCWESGGALQLGGIRTEKGIKDASWVTQQIFQKQKASPSRFIYYKIIMKRVLSHYLPRCPERGCFSSPCRRANSP